MVHSCILPTRTKSSVSASEFPSRKCVQQLILPDATRCATLRGPQLQAADVCPAMLASKRSYAKLLLKKTHLPPARRCGDRQLLMNLPGRRDQTLHRSINRGITSKRHGKAVPDLGVIARFIFVRYFVENVGRSTPPTAALRGFTQGSIKASSNRLWRLRRMLRPPGLPDTAQDRAFQSGVTEIPANRRSLLIRR